ncbi:cyanophycinase [Mesobacillus maritimus]|uniref:cyanophycinase n=1 Tax=Mesobacillus maritimus TaxID=1643336 RepID=UPI00203C2A23|nr:cyanophycinase [Mesobacillus maritimus]MCM3586214.1 cyanophycinase [Mesobacillus maritimus]MCM3667541.1 cyanophycinase [Mesobacillus maritimus]
MSPGRLLIIGGNEEKCKTGEILHAFLELSKERQGAIGILPTASSIPDEITKGYMEVFENQGVKDIEVIDVDSRQKADDPAILETVSNLGSLFITGGDQKRLSDCIRNTKLHTLLLNKWQSGLLIGGTSAGATIMGEEMIIYSEMKNNEEERLLIEMGKGFGFEKKLLIDQHFSQRARFGRLITAIAENNDLVGIGIDENTAILVEGDQFEVIGEHQVFVIDGKNGSLVDFVRSENGGEELTITDFKLHALTDGYCFNLSSRKIMKRKEA